MILKSHVQYRLQRPARLAHGKHRSRLIWLEREKLEELLKRYHMRADVSKMQGVTYNEESYHQPKDVDCDGRPAKYRRVVFNNRSDI